MTPLLINVLISNDTKAIAICCDLLPQFTPSAERLIASDAHDDLVEVEGGEEGEDEDEDKEKEDEAMSFTIKGSISLATLLRVFQHETSKVDDNHRFSGYLTAEDHYEVG